MLPRRHVGRAGAALGWALVYFVGAQLLINVIVDTWYPGQFDPEFYARLDLLRVRLVKEAGRPMVLLLGSSRTVGSFLPEELPPLATAGGDPVLPFNFSHIAGGPAMNLVTLHRLLDHGIRPDWLVVEILPSQLGDAKQNVITDTLSVRDLPVVARCRGYSTAAARYVRERLMPCYKQRSFILSRLAPRWLPPDTRLQPDTIKVGLGPLGGDYGWFTLRSLDAAEIRRRTLFARSGYLPALEDLQICAMSDRAIHELLGVCRQEHIRVLFVLTPEGSEFRSWYPPAKRALVERYCAALGDAYHVPVVDARTWLGDEAFWDSHHVLFHGAEAFTRRLGEEVLRPFIQGRSAVPSCLAGPRE